MSLPDDPEFGQGPLHPRGTRDGNVAGTPTSLRPSYTTSGTSEQTTTSPAGAWSGRRTMQEGDTAFYAGTLHGYGGLVSRIRRQFEMMVPEMFRKVSKLEDGGPDRHR